MGIITLNAPSAPRPGPACVLISPLQPWLTSPVLSRGSSHPLQSWVFGQAGYAPALGPRLPPTLADAGREAYGGARRYRHAAPEGVHRQPGRHELPDPLRGHSAADEYAHA